MSSKDKTADYSNNFLVYKFWPVSAKAIQWLTTVLQTL